MFLFRFRFEYEILQKENQRKFQNQTFKREIIKHFENSGLFIMNLLRYNWRIAKSPYESSAYLYLFRKDIDHEPNRAAFAIIILSC